MEGKRILVTGASGGMGVPLSSYLAGLNNEVFGAARFSDPAARERLEKAGVHTITADLGDESYDAIPRDFDYVFHCGAIVSYAAEVNPALTLKVNAQGTGRLMSHVRTARGFVHCSTGSLYAYQGHRPIREEDPYGLHIPTYSFSKIQAEALVEFCSREFGLPAIMIRICSLYSEEDGSPTSRVEKVAKGETVLLHPDTPNNYNPIFRSDYCELAVRAAEVASCPPIVVNFAGSETMSAEDYCNYAAELMGTTAKIEYSNESWWPLWPDVTRMHEILGRTKVGVREGIRKVVEARFPDRIAVK
ncbi:MAG: NAD-dependent epimerase/dehydratase family protein [Vicinamibacterales bacterium]